MKNYLQAKLFGIILESKFRLKRLQVEKIVSTINIKPGHTIADIGAGTGLFSRLFAQAAQPGGTAYAVDTNPVLLKKIGKKKKTDNLKPVLASDTDFNLPEKVDIMFMCDVLHHVEDKSGFLNNVRKYLKEDGVLAIIDFSEKWPPFHKSMKFTIDEYEAWIKNAGLKKVKEHDFLKDSMWSFFHICRLEMS
ncbi:MAG: class I SAM-dependent methyltransferase [Deltaproteobacteria bacterium]|nr:class I SAM-dependent methyltransferase [Deltaproteobacteria bacterium]